MKIILSPAKKMNDKEQCSSFGQGVVRTTYLIDEQGIIIKSNDKVKAADDPERMLQELS